MLMDGVFLALKRWINGSIGNFGVIKIKRVMGVNQSLCHLPEVADRFFLITSIINVHIRKYRLIAPVHSIPIGSINIPKNIIIVHASPKRFKYIAESAGSIALWPVYIFYIFCTGTDKKHK